jgi:hypothetical protein
LKKKLKNVLKSPIKRKKTPSTCLAYKFSLLVELIVEFFEFVSKSWSQELEHSTTGLFNTPHSPNRRTCQTLVSKFEPTT